MTVRDLIKLLIDVDNMDAEVRIPAGMAPHCLYPYRVSVARAEEGKTTLIEIDCLKGTM